MFSHYHYFSYCWYASTLDCKVDLQYVWLHLKMTADVFCQHGTASWTCVSNFTFGQSQKTHSCTACPYPSVHVALVLWWEERRSEERRENCNAMSGNQQFEDTWCNFTVFVTDIKTQLHTRWRSRQLSGVFFVACQCGLAVQNTVKCCWSPPWFPFHVHGRHKHTNIKNGYDSCHIP